MMPYDYCPDPERAQHNIESFLEINPGYRDRLNIYIREVALLFSHSQFLANFSISHPEKLFIALENLDLRVRESLMRRELTEMLILCDDISQAMQSLRIFKRSKLLHITLRDILALQDTQSVLYDLSILAEVILSVSLRFLMELHRKRYGHMEDNTLAVIGLGKLGAQELNYSSDVDLIFVYREDKDSEGVVSPNGSVINRFSASEYYSKLIEEYTRLLSRPTDEGLVYRVDLRLRPQGQKGPVAMSLRAYEDYYESWGQLWERAALLRARPIAGDIALGKEFCDMIRPFVFRKYLDTETIRTLRDMKSQVEHIKPDTVSRDIKRGYGGIREIEFFIHIFQLLNGGREPMLREKSTLVLIHRLLEKRLIGHEDYKRLFEGYLFLRTLENRLQQANDLQTHSLPTSDKELTIIARKMGFTSSDAFMSFLAEIRASVREIYDSLLVSENTPTIDLGLLDNYYWDADSPIENLIMQELASTTIADKQRALYCLMKIRNSMHSFQTIRGRRLMEQIVPRFVEAALKSNNPDRALAQLVDLCQVFANNESYLEAVINREGIVPELIFVLSQSEYLSRLIISKAEYLDTLLLDSIKRPSLYGFNKELALSSVNYTDSSAIRVFKKKKEIFLGMAFLTGRIDIIALTRGLSYTAEAVLQALQRRVFGKDYLKMGNNPLSIIAYGKLGGREIIFNSDLDIVFVTDSEPTNLETKACQAILRELMTYTKEGYLYKFDTRLRPDGSKGVLVISLEALKRYYLDTARVWELQALIKARPVGDLNSVAPKFMALRQEVLTRRSQKVTRSEVLAMRNRICKELSKETVGNIDLKLGRGGIIDIDFVTQYLQISRCTQYPSLLCQDTVNALRRLGNIGIIDAQEALTIQDSYKFLRTIEAILRLSGESVLKTEGQQFNQTATFLDIEPERLMGKLMEVKRHNEDFLYKYLG